MKCSLKDIFINILFIIIIIIIIIVSPSEEFPLFVAGGSPTGNPMNLQQLRASINRLQDLDSFPINSDNKLHKIVKKQMTSCDYNERKTKRSTIFAVPEGLKSFRFKDSFAGDIIAKGDWNSKLSSQTPIILKPKNSASTSNYELYLTKLAEFAKKSEIRFSSPLESNKKKKSTETVENPEEPSKEEVPNPEEQHNNDGETEENQNQEMPTNNEEKTGGEQSQEVKPSTEKPEETNQEENVGKSLENAGDADVKKNEVPQKELKEDENQKKPQGWEEWPSMTIEDKIKEFLAEKKLPEIKVEKDDTVEELKEVIKKHKLDKDYVDKDETKKPKQKKIEDKKKVKETKNEKEIKKPEGEDEEEKILEDAKMLDKELQKITKEENEKIKKENENPFLKTKLQRIPDENDFHYYYECEARPNGCLKLKHKRCPQGQFFSFKFLKCLKMDSKREKEKKAEAPTKRQTSIDYVNFEHENEWLDASQDSSIPSEFQTTTTPRLRIYHLRQKRKFSEMTDNVEADVQQKPAVVPNGLQTSEIPFDGTFKKHRKHHTPRSYVIGINKKKGKDQIAENSENDNDNDEDDQEDSEEDEDEESEDDEEENEEEEEVNDQRANKEQVSGQSLKDLFKAAKTAITNRARFEDPTLAIAMNGGNNIASVSKKNIKEVTDSESQNKNVLIDANIKVDSTIGSVLKSFIKSKRKDSSGSLIGNEEALISDRGSQDQLDPELLRMYEHLMRSNPRIKRYFLSTRHPKGK